MLEHPAKQPKDEPEIQTPIPTSELLVGISCLVLAGGIAAALNSYSRRRTEALKELQNSGLPWWKKELMALRQTNKRGVLKDAGRGMLATLGRVTHERLS